MQRFAAVLLLLGILLWPVSSQGQICFDDETAGRMVVALEQARFTEQQLTVMVESNGELQKQLDIVKATVKLLENQIAAYKTFQDTLKSLGEAKDKACQEEIKAARPTFWQNLQKYFVGMGIGGLLVGIAAVLI